jgi:thiol-disulfide isomerase/thioredoxin
MRTILTIVAGLSATALLASCTSETSQNVQTSQSSAPAIETQALEETKVKAVLIYADWCGSCKVLDPKIQSVRANKELMGVKFITLDYTDKDSTAFFEAAREAGVEAAMTAAMGGTIKTGQMFLVDAESSDIRGKIVKTMSEAEIMSAIDAAVADS